MTNGQANELEDVHRQADFQINSLKNQIETLEMRVKDRENKLNRFKNLLSQAHGIVIAAKDQKKLAEQINDLLNG